MKALKKIAAFTAALLTAAAVTCPALADSGMIIEIIPETGDTVVTVKPEKGRTKISRYIYGINDNKNISGFSPTVIKQTGPALSSYNWETNFSNSGIRGHNSNDISLVDNFSSSKWDSPALYTDALISKSMMKNIPVRLVTLQMMGYVARDSMGIVSNDELSRNTRWCKVRFHKNDTYLNQPDISDDVVYMDEYVSYLVNRYGSAKEGGINGYLLDSEPDKWAENYSVLGLEQITPKDLAERSANLAAAVKTIDSNAFVFGPSLSGLQSCINLNNPEAWSDTSDEYSWFIDYYLSYMRSCGENTGSRLLDVLDVHYYTEAITPVGIPVLTNSDEFSNAYRMQAVKTLYDSEYTENSVSVIMNKQFTPFIPTLQASIRINYPGTRLSFSEYDFGGGDNISGAIAQTDVLGIFAKEEVYLACLSPVSEDYSFQKAAINLYTDYDGNGSSFGDTLVYADNDNDGMSSVFAAVNEDDPDTLRIILTNKNMVNDKKFDISIKSDEYSYELSEAYTINSDAEIENIDLDRFDYGSNSVSFEADTTSVYMLVLSNSGAEEISEVSESEAQTETDISETEISEEASVQTEISPELTEEIQTENSSEYTDPADATVPDIVETTAPVTVSSDTETQTVSEETQITEISEVTEPGDEGNKEKSSVAVPFKIIVSALVFCVCAGIVYVLFFDKK